MPITYWRGRLFKYQGPLDGLKLAQELTLDEYLGMQYPPALLVRFPEQASADRDIERRKIQRATQPGDTLWLWHIVDPANEFDGPSDGTPSERGGLAVVRAGVIVRIWQTWSAR